jgi:hypothetical protein
MPLRLHSDAALTTPLSLEGGLSAPDHAENMDGEAGESVTRALYLAVERGTLLYDIDATQPIIQLTAPRFASTTFPIWMCGSEKGLITGGFGTNRLTCTRGYHSTVAAAHLAGAIVYLAYDCNGITIEPADNDGTDESSWITYGTNQTTWAASLSGIGLNYNQSYTLYRKITVPAGTDPAIKIDLLHRVRAVRVDETRSV